MDATLDHPTVELRSRAHRPTLQSPRRRSAAVVLALALVALLAASCGTLKALTDMGSTLRSEGFAGANVSLHSTNGIDQLSVTADSGPGDSTGPIAHRRAAKLVWDTFPRRFDELVIDLGGNVTTYTHSELESMFGQRDANLDAKSLGDDAKGVVAGTAIGLSIGALLCLGLVILVIVLVARSRKRRRSQPDPPYPGAYPPPGYGQPAPPPPPAAAAGPYGQPTYGQPAPPPAPQQPAGYGQAPPPVPGYGMAPPPPPAAPPADPPATPPADEPPTGPPSSF